MLTQVHRGESAPRVTGNYPQGLKGSGQANSHGRNTRYGTSSSVNNPNRGVSPCLYSPAFLSNLNIDQIDSPEVNYLAPLFEPK